MGDSTKYIRRKNSKQIVSAEQLRNTSIIPSQIQIFVQTNTGLRAFFIFQPIFRHPEHRKNERKPEQETV